MKNYIISSLAFLFIATTIACTTSKKPTTVRIEDEQNNVIEYQVMDYNYPLADSIAKYSEAGASSDKVAKRMTTYADDLRPNMRDRASVMQFNNGIIVAMDKGNVFEVSDAILTETGKQQLQHLAFNLKQMPDTYILVVGRTDNTGTQELNEKLAYRRAAYAANYLRGCGIDESRLFIDSFGEKFPDHGNNSAYLRAKNRRVDFMIIPSNEMNKEQ
ncbi:Outer membrane protein OmpA [Spirosomataceae bacterium TFI 002]|nr:Outer membrane protein OmpA [Spirosomataceae bacterium TFI 002]